MTVEKKDIQNQAELDLARAQYAPVLGKDPLGVVIKYNLARLLTVDLLTQGFVWVLGANWILWEVLHRTQASETVALALIAHAVIAWFYWAARAQFRQLVNAACAWLAGKGSEAPK